VGAVFEAKRDQVDALARFEATFAGAITGMLLMLLMEFKAINDSLGHAAGDDLLVESGLAAGAPRPLRRRLTGQRRSGTCHPRRDDR
jgi:predicted signal transduction protein with EAL and GGDEF domain